MSGSGWSSISCAARRPSVWLAHADVRIRRSPRLPPLTSRLTMRDLIAEFRQAVRSLSRTPGFSLAVILTLGLGIGANTAIFSVVDGVLLRPAPFEDMDRLTMVWETDRKSGTLREPASDPRLFRFSGAEQALRAAGGVFSHHRDRSRWRRGPGRVWPASG